MLFSSTVFLFCFLPIVGLLYLCVNRALKQYVLLFSSLFFYAWGEPSYLAIMLLVCVISYSAALGIAQCRARKRKIWLLAGAVLCDLLILGYFKYFDFLIENINRGFGTDLYLLHIVMPIGISFFTFQALSYVVDVYRGDAGVQRSFAKLVLYISFFPQLIAGPIVKYHDIEEDINHNKSSLGDVAYGMRRFIIGLGKKVLIANPLGAIADPIFDHGFANADLSVAWLGAITYSLQLFFDFSGYSDMAIGLGRMFGFHFLENFNYPYISKSITEFWRRWHISLGTWFREYVYIPLGGNRHGKWRTCINLLVVFAVTGLWHGANWTFVLWGMWHGLFIVIERLCGIKGESTMHSHAWFRHAYTILVFVVGWTMFRADTVEEGLRFLAVMFGIYSPEAVEMTAFYYLTFKNAIIIGIALLLSMPLGAKFCQSQWVEKKVCGRAVLDTYLIGVLVLSIASLAASTYNPFIYFRF